MALFLLLSRSSETLRLPEVMFSPVAKNCPGLPQTCHMGHWAAEDL